jgi:hypothetical protein
MKTIGPTLIAIIVSLVLALIYWSIYIRSSKTGTVADYKLSFITSPTIMAPDYEKSYLIPSLITDRKSFLVPGKGNGITIVMDIYINNTPMNANWGSSYKRSKPILQIGESPCVYYTPNTGDLSLVLKYRDNPYYSNYPEIIYPDLKLQKWNKLIIVVDNRNIRFYLNGNIVKSQTIDGVPIIYDNDIKIGELNNNISGKIRQLDVYPLPVGPEDINKL